MIPFATSEWAAALKDAINASATYRDAARTWEGDFWFIVEPAEGRPESDRRLMYLDLWHGECRTAVLAQSEAEWTPEFRIWAPPRNWRRVINREIDPIRALMTNQLRLKGNLAKIMRNVRAAQELVLCAANVPTNFEF
jgi:putative sterol carrier protein